MPVNDDSIIVDDDSVNVDNLKSIHDFGLAAQLPDERVMKDRRKPKRWPREDFINHNYIHLSSFEKDDPRCRYDMRHDGGGKAMVVVDIVTAILFEKRQLEFFFSVPPRLLVCGLLKFVHQSVCFSSLYRSVYRFHHSHIAVRGKGYP